MNYIKIIIALIVFVGFSSICYGDSIHSSGGKIHFQCSTPDSVVNKANQAPSLSSPFPSILQDPMVNSMLGGYSNMMQGTTGTSYSAEELRRQQMDYAKQQANSVDVKEEE